MIHLLEAPVDCGACTKRGILHCLGVLLFSYPHCLPNQPIVFIAQTFGKKYGGWVVFHGLWSGGGWNLEKEVPVAGSIWLVGSLSCPPPCSLRLLHLGYLSFLPGGCCLLRLFERLFGALALDSKAKGSLWLHSAIMNYSVFRAFLTGGVSRSCCSTDILLYDNASIDEYIIICVSILLSPVDWNLGCS